MANPEHVEVVKQGAEAIRKWREDNPNVKLDLGGADLTGADLTGADLIGADLSRAHLEGASLREAYLTGARLDEARLAAAYLEGVLGAHQAHGLETTQLGGGDARYFEACDRLWLEYLLDWERLRVIGRLPLFVAARTN